MTAKDCGHHEEDQKKLHRLIFAGIFAVIAIVLFIILLVWLILRPTKPLFILQDATVYAFNVSAPNFLTTNFQITLFSRNPNDRIGIYYDRVDVYASYRGQQITLPTLLPSSYQGHKDITVWSPFVYGNTVPVAPYYTDALNQDQMAGTVLINIRVNGKIRWKVGSFISGRYHLNVNCPAYINLGNKNIIADNNGGTNIRAGPAIKYLLVQLCYVDV